MKHLWTVPLVSLAFTSLLAIADRPALAATLFQSTLNGSQEVPPTSTPATGSATLELTGNPGSYVLDYEIAYSGLLTPIDAPYGHIHNAPFGSEGPIVHHLDGAEDPPIAGSQSGVIVGDWRFDDPSDPLTDTLVQELLGSNLYFNIHTSGLPGGEIRGQIEPVPVASVPEPGTLMGLAFVVGGVGLSQGRKCKHP